MNEIRTAPPAAASCLLSSYASRGGAGQKGGTLINETVIDLAAHEAMMRDPGSYRPAECRCGCTRLHLHDRRERRGRGSGGAVVTVVIFLCARCFATWRVLPAFLARCLWRTWAVVEAALVIGDSAVPVPVPARTVQRWHARLAQAALAATQALATSGDPALRVVARRVGLAASRATLVKAFATSFETSLLAPLAALLHRLSPGLRLM